MRRGREGKCNRASGECAGTYGRRRLEGEDDSEGHVTDEGMKTSGEPIQRPTCGMIIERKGTKKESKRTCFCEFYEKRGQDDDDDDDNEDFFPSVFVRFRSKT